MIKWLDVGHIANRSEAYHLPTRFICGALSNVAVAYGKLQKYKKVVEIQLCSLRLQEQHAIQPNISATYEGISNAYRNLVKPRQALPYYQQALAIRRAENERSEKRTWALRMI